MKCEESKVVFGKYPCEKCCFAGETACNIPKNLECNDKETYWRKI